MPTTFTDRSIGERDDRVEVRLGDQTVIIAESYSVKCEILTQPAAWSIRIGHGGAAAELLRRFPPNTPFELRIGGNPQQTGNVDAVTADEAPGGTEVSIRGRDSLAPLHDDLIDAERAFNTDTYTALVLRQLDEVGLGDRVLFTTNRANREIKGGVKFTELEPVKTVEQIRLEAGGGPSGADGVRHVQVQAHLGERRYEFLMRYLGMAGLFLWATADGSFVLSEPNANQKACAAIIRKLTSQGLLSQFADKNGKITDTVTTKVSAFANATEHRFARYRVYGHGAGKKGGHPKAFGEFLDTEMQDLGFKKSKTVHSPNIRTKEQAEFTARRIAAEDRRQGFTLRYVVSGHSCPVGGGQRMVWTPDTVVTIDDDILNVHEDMYLEGCEYRRGPQTETELTFVRRKDLVFGPGEF